MAYGNDMANAIMNNDGAKNASVANSALQTAMNTQNMAYLSSVQASNSLANILGTQDENGNWNGWTGLVQQRAKTASRESKEAQEKQQRLQQELDYYNQSKELQKALDTNVQNETDKAVYAVTGLKNEKQLDTYYNQVMTTKLKANPNLTGLTSKDLADMIEHPNLIPIKSAVLGIDETQVRNFLQDKDNAQIINLYSGLKLQKQQIENNELSGEALRTIAENSYGTYDYQGMTTNQIQNALTEGQYSRLGKKPNETLEEFNNRRKEAQFKDVTMGNELLKSIIESRNSGGGGNNGGNGSNPNGSGNGNANGNSNQVVNPDTGQPWTVDEIREQAEIDAQNSDTRQKDLEKIKQNNFDAIGYNGELIEGTGEKQKFTKGAQAIFNVVNSNEAEVRRNLPELIVKTRDLGFTNAIRVTGTAALPLTRAFRVGKAKDVAKATQAASKELAAQVDDAAKLAGSAVKEEARKGIRELAKIGLSKGVAGAKWTFDSIKKAREALYQALPEAGRKRLLYSLSVGGAIFTANQFFTSELTASQRKQIADLVRDYNGDESYEEQGFMNKSLHAVGQFFGLSTGTYNDELASFITTILEVRNNFGADGSGDQEAFNDFLSIQNYDVLQRALDNQSGSMANVDRAVYAKWIEYGRAVQAKQLFLDQANLERNFKNKNSHNYAFNASDLEKEQAIVTAMDTRGITDKKTQMEAKSNLTTAQLRYKTDTMTKINGTLGYNSTTKVAPTGNNILRSLTNSDTLNLGTKGSLSLKNENGDEGIKVEAPKYAVPALIFEYTHNSTPESVNEFNKILQSEDFKKDFGKIVNRAQDSKIDRAKVEKEFAEMFYDYFVDGKGHIFSTKGNDSVDSKAFDSSKQLKAYLSREFNLYQMIRSFAGASNLSGEKALELLTSFSPEVRRRRVNQIPYRKKVEKR